MRVSFMTTFHRALDDSTSCRNRWSCALPSIVRLGLSILRLHAGATGSLSDGISALKTLRLLSGAVGARSGWPVSGLSQVPLAEAFALLNERSSRKKSSRFFPHLNVR